MLTTADIKKLITVFVTKDDLRDLLDERFEALEHKFNNGFEKLYKELIEIRTEQTAHKQIHQDTENRFKRIERTPAVAHELKIKR